MRFENPQPAEDLHTDDIHPLHEFAWLVAGCLVLLIGGALLLARFAGDLAARVPYHIEREYADRLGRAMPEPATTPAARAAEQALRELAAAVARDMGQPADFAVTIHYQDSDIPNAFATLGGHVVVFRGLIARLDSEDALAAVLAHELAHVRLRHPARGLGSGIALGLVLSTVSSSLGGLAGESVNKAGMLPMLRFSREQEHDADAIAYAVLAKRYGHVGGAQDLFRLFSRLHEGQDRLEFLQTHPLDAQREARLGVLAQQHGWRLDGSRRPLPAPLQALRRAD